RHDARWMLDGRAVLAGASSEGSKFCGRGGWYGAATAAVEWLEFIGVYDSHVECVAPDCIDRDVTRGARGCRAGGRQPSASAAILPGLALWSRWRPGTRRATAE